MKHKILTKAFILFLIMNSIGTLYAQERNEKKDLVLNYEAQTFSNNVTDPECPRLNLIDLICLSVLEKTTNEDEESEFNYRYEEILYSIVCADTANETKEEIIKKIHDVWVIHEDRFICDANNFSVPNGNILKYAAQMEFADFLYEVSRTWMVPLNKIDKSDGRTTLDYISDEMKNFAGKPEENILKAYYDLLQKAGAKHKSQLTSEELARNGMCVTHANCPANAPCKK